MKRWGRPGGWGGSQKLGMQVAPISKPTNAKIPYSKIQLRKNYTFIQINKISVSSVLCNTMDSDDSDHCHS